MSETSQSKMVEDKRRGSNSFVNDEGRVIRGKPCEFPGCHKRSQSQGKCKAHGGGKRCIVEGCTRSSQGSGRCRTHGGGKRCQFEGCTKGIQRYGYCYQHGTGKHGPAPKPKVKVMKKVKEEEKVIDATFSPGTSAAAGSILREFVI